MLKIHLVSVGKNKEAWLEEAIAEYTKRLQPSITLQCTWVKDDAQLLALTEKERLCIGLDPSGKSMTSETFSHWLYKRLEEGGSKLCLVIGAAEGLPPSFKQSHELISLSPLTFTHQIARLILIEQLYRASEIRKGSEYHK